MVAEEAPLQALQQAVERIERFVFREDPGNLEKQGNQESRKKEKSKIEKPSSLNELYEQVVRELKKSTAQEASTVLGSAAQSRRRGVSRRRRPVELSLMQKEYVL